MISYISYIDEVIGIDVPSHIDASFDSLYSLVHQLGIEVSQKKIIKLSTSINCLGIPDDKLQEIHHLCRSWHHKSDQKHAFGQFIVCL